MRTTATMQQRHVPGRSVVTRRAIVDVVLAAVQGSYGVSGLSDPNPGARLLRWLGLERRGIRLAHDDGIGIDLYLTVASGVPVAEVARQVDSAVRYGLRRAVGREVERLTIHVGGVGYQPAGAVHEPVAAAPSAARDAGDAAAGGAAAGGAGATNGTAATNGAAVASSASSKPIAPAWTQPDEPA